MQQKAALISALRHKRATIQSLKGEIACLAKSADIVDPGTSWYLREAQNDLSTTSAKIASAMKLLEHERA